MFSLSFHLYGVFFLLLTLNSLTQSKIILPFKLFFPNSTYANYLDKYYINYLGTEISIGTPPQKFILNLNSSTNTFWVLSHRAELPFPSYDLTKSSSVKDGNSFITKVKDVILDEGQHRKDIIMLDKQNVLMDIFTGIKVNSHYINSGIIGLDISGDSYYFNDIFFIKQLKQKDIISSYAFYVKYNKDNSGSLIIGEYPHDSDSRYKKNNMIPYRTTIDGGRLKWGLTFMNIKHNGTDFEVGSVGIIKIESGLIIGTKEYSDIIYDSFFKDKISSNQCKEITSEVYEIFSYQCDKDAQIENYPMLFFNVDGINKMFNFTFKELFEYEDGHYNYMIAFNKMPTHSKWILGTPFIKNHMIVFDQDRKLIAPYLEDSANDLTLYYIWIVICILILLIILMLCYLRRRRHIRYSKKKQIESTQYRSL